MHVYCMHLLLCTQSLEKMFRGFQFNLKVLEIEIETGIGTNSFK